ncbi:MAG: DNA polymerase III subunit delta [Muribaculaceae bacterium]|nr:DNA polymerase III subunit delta [Muribaculaceae bacterium]
MKFSEIAGHKDTISALRDIVDSGRIPHAILFSGISGIGKMRVARALAQYIHCHNRINGDACGVCPSCLQHKNFNNPDVHFSFPIIKKDLKNPISSDYIDKWKEMLSDWSYMPPEKWNELLQAGNSQPVIYVGESEDIIGKASLSSYQENYKIFIIWLPEKLRPEAANKLLKVIEEPFEDTIFILVSNDDSKLLPTIFSRTQRFNLHPLSENDIASYLQQTLHVGADLAASSARIAEGSMGKAEAIACHPDELLEFSDLFKEIMRMAYALKADRLKAISELTASMGREKLLRFLSYCNRMIRENFIYNLRLPQVTLMTPEEEAFSMRFSPFIHEGNVEALSNEISRASADIERNANGKIVMFDLMLLISQWVRMPKPNPLGLNG